MIFYIIPNIDMTFLLSYIFMVSIKFDIGLNGSLSSLLIENSKNFLVGIYNLIFSLGICVLAIAAFDV